MPDIKPGTNVHKSTGQMFVGETEEVIKRWSSPGGIECCWVKYPCWSVPILEFTSALIAVRENGNNSNNHRQLNLFDTA
jgi:hypothetical protein